MACNLHKIATINLRDLEAALDLVEQKMSVPTNRAQDYMNELDLHTLVYSDINVLIKNAFEAGWTGHEKWESDAAEYECSTKVARTESGHFELGQKVFT